MNSIKKIVMIAMVLTLAFCSQSVFAAEEQIKDMPTGWAKDAVQNAVKQGLLTPYGDKIYPDRPLTRAEMAAMMNRLFHAEAKASLDSFQDVPVSSWYAADMAKAVQMQAFQGSEGKLMPERKITRQEAFVVLSRILSLSADVEDSLKNFQDGNSVSAWAKGATASMVKAGYVSGSNGKIHPLEMITRAEFAQMMYQISKDRIDQQGEYTQNYNGNLLISVPEVTLKNAVISGDLILCDGVASGNVTLDHVTVEGRIVVRGGGKNTVELIASKVKGDMVINNVNHPVRILASDGTTLNTVIAQNYVILDAPISLLRLESQADVTVQSKTITSMMVKAGATGSRITVESGASIGTAVIEASKTSLLGGGQVTQVQAKGNELSVNTPGTQVRVDSGITGVKAGGVAVEGGKHVVVNQSGNGVVASANVSNSSSGGSGGNGGSGGSSNSGGGNHGGGDTPSVPELNPTNKNWVDLTKTGIVPVDFVSYATIALRLDEMKKEEATEYEYYIEGVKQHPQNLSKVMKSADGSLLVIKFMLPNNSESQRLKLVKGNEYMQIQLKNIGYSIKE